MHYDKDNEAATTKESKMNRTEARAKMTAMADTRDLDQSTSDLIELNKMEYTTEVAITSTVIIGSIGRRFPEVADKAWEIIDAMEEGKPEVFMDFSEALLLARAALNV